MKKLIIILIVLFGAYQGLQKLNHPVQSAPVAITNPVYGETRVTMGHATGDVELVILTKAADFADCRAQTERLQKDYAEGPFATCATCTPPKSECVEQLPPRFANMFANQPGSLTYLAMAPGNAAERDHRVVFWGVTVEQSDTLCNEVPAFQKNRKGAVSCVKAKRG